MPSLIPVLCHMPISFTSALLYAQLGCRRMRQDVRTVRRTNTVRIMSAKTNDHFLIQSNLLYFRMLLVTLMSCAKIKPILASCKLQNQIISFSSISYYIDLCYEYVCRDYLNQVSTEKY
jgi:hypothetical protein